MKKLGLSTEDIYKLDPGENPFLNWELGEHDFGRLIEQQQQFYSQLRLYYKMNRDSVVADAEVAQATAGKNEGTYDDLDEPIDLKKWPDLEPPSDFEKWEKKKQLIFEHKTLKRLKEFFKDVRYDVKRGKLKDTFLKDYTQGEIKAFDEILKRMVESKGAEAHQIVINNEIEEIDESDFEEELSNEDLQEDFS